MLTKLITLSALLPLSYAFYDTVPLVAWSSHENALVMNLNAQKKNLYDLQVERLLSSENEEEDRDVCNFDAVVVFEQPGLHATDLKSLPSTSSIPARLRSTRSSVQVPYVKRRSSASDSEEVDVSVLSAVEDFARRCGAKLQWISESGLEGGEAEQTGKSVFYVALPEVYGEGAWRRYRMAELEDSLTRILTRIESSYPKHLVIYTGSLPSTPSLLAKRQSSSSLSTPFAFAFAPSNSTTTSEGGILARYQLLTPGLILSLSLAFFVLLPAVLMGISALASIQSPVRLDAPRGVTAGKKNQ